MRWKRTYSHHTVRRVCVCALYNSNESNMKIIEHILTVTELVKHRTGN